ASREPGGPSPPVRPTSIQAVSIPRPPPYQPNASATIPPMKILVAGSSGLVGSALLPHLVSQGHHAVRLVRGRPARGDAEVAWDPDAGSIDSARLHGIDAVVNLAGATIARWPWTAAHKRRVLEILDQAIAREDWSGPLNAVAPSPSTNAEFTKTVGRVLNRPTLLPLPAFAARLVLGEMADALLLASQRVEPARLQASGFQFRFP